MSEIFEKLKARVISPLKPLKSQVIVITGASSGIGLATALEGGKRGARLVLVSRNENALVDVKRRIEDLGGQAIYVVADVGNKDDIQKVVQASIDAFGGFDTWVNDAGVGVMAMLKDISDEDSRRLFDTNFWGLVYGSMAAADHLKTKGGAIINLGSLLSDISVPLQGMYCASKHAVKGFTDTLRQELEAEKVPISVTLIKPAAIATPFFTHAKNYMPNEPKAPQPVYSPDEVAYAILRAAAYPFRDVRIGGAGYVMSAMNAHSPRLMDWLNQKFMIKSQMSDNPKSRSKSNLHESGMDGDVFGKNMKRPMKSVYTRATLHPVFAGIALTIVGAAAYTVLNRKKSSPTSRAAKKALMTGIELLAPLQNIVIAKGLLKYFDKQSESASKAIRDGIKDTKKAVNENAKIIKYKTLTRLK